MADEEKLVDLEELEEGKLWIYRRVLKSGRPSKVWQARFKLPNENPHLGEITKKESTKCRDKTSAARWARDELSKKVAEIEESYVSAAEFARERFT
jgi:hypothetical protein